MDLSKGISLNQQKHFQIQQLWVPTTPANPSTASSQRSHQLSGPCYLEPPVNVSTGAQKTAPPWEFACQLGSSSSSSLPNHLQDVMGSQAAALASSGHATTGSIIMLHAPATSISKVDSLERWSALLSGNVNAACNVSGTSEVPPCAPLLVQIGSRQVMPAIQNMLPVNGKVILAASLSNSTCSSSSHKDEYKIPVTCLPNLNSLPECLTSVSRTVTMSAPQTPATTEKYYKRMQDKQPTSEVSNLIEAGARAENLMRKEVTSSPLALEKLESGQDINVVSDEMSNQLIGVEKSCIHRENDGMDLNVTPQKKTQRKKHRPKVIIEGKSSRTPKPETPQPGTHKEGRQKENTSCKRKYVRRIKDVTSTETASNALGEIVDLESKARAKSARRCLNFDLEESDEFSAAMSMFKKVLGAHVQEACDDGAVKSSSMKEIVDSTREQDQEVVNLLLGTVSDLNSSTYQSQNECTIMPEIPAPATEVNKNMSASEKHMSSLKSSEKRFKKLERKTYYMDADVNPESSLESAQSNLTCNRISDAPLKDAIKGHLLPDEAFASAQKKSTHSYNLRGCSIKDYAAGRQAPCVKEVHKRIRMENGQHNEAKSNFSSKLMYTMNTWKMTQLSNNSHELTLDAQSSIAEDRMQASKHMLSFEQTKEDMHNNLDVGSKPAFINGIRGYSMDSSPVKSCRQKNKDIIQPPTPQKLSEYSNHLENKICENQAHLETPKDVNKHVKAKTRTGRKKQDQIHLLNPMPSSTKQTYLEEHEASCSDGNPPVNTIASSTLTTRSLNGKNLNPEIISLVCQSTSCFKASAYPSISFGAFVPFIDPVDDIAQKLRQLHISRCHEVASSQAKNAVVPYVGHKGMMIPYERNFLTKRRRPRAKVDLDPESSRVWKLLMGKDDNEGDVQADVDKEKWWEEERRVFRGRVNSFIARMHLVQGDRRFSQWKGSVVDSVVGVFLTQNVSDHLSSSAFMSLAANFPLQSSGKSSEANGEKGNQTLFDAPKLQRNLLDHGFCFHNSSEINVIKNEAQKESSNCGEIIGCVTGNIITNYYKEKSKVNSIDLHEKEIILCHDSPASGSGTTVTFTGSTSLAEMEDIRLFEDVVSSQMSVISSQSSMWCHSQSSDHNRLNSFSKSEAENLLSRSMNNALSCSSFTQLIRMAESSSFEEFFRQCSGTISDTKPLEVHFAIENNPSALEQLDCTKGTCQSCRFDSNLHHALFGSSDMSLPLQSCQDDPFNSKIMENNVNLLKENIRAHSTSYEEIDGYKFEVMSSESEESTSLPKLLSSYKTTSTIDSYAPICEQSTQQVTFSDMEVGANMQSDGNHKTAENFIDASSNNENPHVCSRLQTEEMTKFQQNDVKSVFAAESSHDADQAKDQIEACKNQESTASNNYTEHKLDLTCKIEQNMQNETYKYLRISAETPKSGTKPKKNRPVLEKNTYDWESLRKMVCCNIPAEGRSNTTMDSLDWEAVRTADVSKIAETIRGRGMNNKLAERIKEFLNRLVREHGSIDLEWLRDVPPDKAKDFLLSIRGLGLKSAECVRLLTLQHLAFPVDTNVGRICVRLGWVPLQPLPESLQLHLLELYPVLETIQKYLWPRLCKLDQRTLYELHYQMITFGKVFCTKSKPNCNSCPMRGECRHFASAFTSARLALPASEDKSVVSFTTPIASEISHTVLLNPRSVPQLELEGSSHSQEFTFQNNCEPIVEEPASPEPECPETMESAIEDAFYEDPDEIPTIKLNFEEFTQNLQNYMQENMELQDGSLSQALVALTPKAASIPMPKLKNVTRLRTEHQVYEIPDSHQLLEGLDPREPDDPSPYLLAIWTPGEIAQSTETPKAWCNAQDTGQLCANSTCFACNSIRESKSLQVRGTLLIPCRTAMRGSFPLNGTYFQVNEVFADHHSSCNPINVPRDLIWNLPRRTVYFGTSIPTIFRGLTTEGIQQCFWRGFLCVRGFDRVTRAPKPLYARLHFPASKAPKNRKAAATAVPAATATREGDLIMIHQPSRKS